MKGLVMPLKFKLPDIGEGIAEGEITTWLVKQGETITEDQPMVEVMTDKATVEIPSPRAGTILEILVEEGTVVPIGTAIVVIGESGEEAQAAQESTGEETEAADEAPAESSSPTESEQDSEPVAAPASAEAPAAGGDPSFGAGAGPRPGGKVLAAPSVRRQARERGIDIDTIAGSGPSGRVLAEDLEQQERAAERAPRTFPSGGQERFKLKGIRRKISERLSESIHKAVHVTHVDEVDASGLIALKRGAAEQAEAEAVKLTFLPFIVKGLIATLRRYPMFNAAIDEETSEIVHFFDYHVGIAVATDRGLLVPVVRHADRKDYFQLAREIAAHAAATRDASIGPQDLQGSTISITNYGGIGGLFATPIINFPEAAIVGVGGIQPRPVAVDGQVVIRPMMYMGITFDHRIADGAEGARFMNLLKRYLEEPGLLLLEK